MSKDYVREAEKNAVRIAQDMSDMFSVLDALSHFGNTVIKGRRKEQYFKGLAEMRSAMYEEYVHAQANCLLFAWTGTDAQKYSRKMFEERFDEKNKQAIMNLLERWGHSPSCWKNSDEEEFRTQAKELLEKA